MGSSGSKPVAVFALLLGVWVGTYWLYDPGPPKISFAKAGGLTDAGQGTPPAGTGTPPAHPQPLVQVTGVEAPRFTTYTVQTGDTSLAVIARRTLGDPRYAEAIARANPLVSPAKLIPGRTVLRIPVDPENIQGRVVQVEVPREALAEGTDKPEPGHRAALVPPPGGSGPTSERTHVVQAGETLSGIAHQYYSSPGAYLRLYDANKDRLKSPDALKVGMTLRIPAGF